MASTNYYTVKIHSYRFCVSYIDFSVSRVGPTRTAYSIFLSTKYSEISISEQYFTKEYIFGLSCVSQKLAGKCKYTIQKDTNR